MIDFQPIRKRKGAPTLVEQIVQAFADAIARQTLRPGMAIPSVREFARQHGLSTFTVASAYGRLVAQGWFGARAGSGYRVSGAGRAVRTPQPAGWAPPRLNTGWLLSDIYADHSIPIKAGCGWLPGEWLNEEGLHQALRHMGRVPALRISGYGHPQGYAPLRESIAAALALHGLPLESEQIVLTQGVTHGLDLVIRTLLRPGDVVLVEAPCYANLLQLLRLTGMRAVAVPRDEAGLDLAALEQAVQGDEAFVIGGAQIYTQALALATRIIATEIQADVPGDAFFPLLPAFAWRETARQAQPEENGLRYDFVTYQRA